MKLLPASKSVSMSLLAASVIATSAWITYAQPKAPAATSTAPATATATTERTPFIATINNMPIRREEFSDALIQIGGLRLLEEFWSFAVTMQALDTASIRLDKPDFEQAKDMILQRVFANNPEELRKLTPENRDRVIMEVLARQGVASPLQADWQIKTLAGLNRLAKIAKDNNDPAFAVTPEQIDLAKKLSFGEKAEIFDFVFDKFDDTADLVKKLNEKKGQELPKTVQELAKAGYRVQGMVLAEADPNLPAKFKSAIFATGMAKGSVTPAIKDERNDKYHVIVINERIAPQPGEPKDAKAFEKSIMDQREAMWRQAKLNDLKARSHVEIYDPILRTQRDQIVAIQKAAAAAATQTQPATTSLAPTGGAGTAPATLPK